MPNVSGPSVDKRRLLASVVTNKLLYAAPVWIWSGLRFRINCKALDRALRLGAVRITRCYCMVSTPAAFFLAEVPPGNVLAKERKSRTWWRKQLPERQSFDAAMTEVARRHLLAQWQSWWSANSGMAAWTKRILPSVTRWVKRLPGAPVTFNLAQVLTGHGAFQSYLLRFARTGSPSCIYCDALDNDTENTIFWCPYWASKWTMLSERLSRDAAPEDKELILCGPGQGQHQRSWGAVKERTRRVFLDIIESIKEAEKRESN